MLVIRGAQMTALGEKHLLDSLVLRARARHADALGDTPLEEVRSFVARAIEKARVYRVLQPDDVERFVGLVLALGLDLDTERATAWAGDILSHPLLTGTEKLRQIEARLARDGR